MIEILRWPKLFDGCVVSSCYEHSGKAYRAGYGDGDVLGTGNGDGTGDGFGDGKTGGNDAKEFGALYGYGGYLVTTRAFGDGDLSGYGDGTGGL